jgi:hypothetical protein
VSADSIASLLPLGALQPEQLEALETIPESEAAALVRHIYWECKNSPVARDILPTLFAAVEQSDRSFSEWIREIIEVFCWLERADSTARFADVVEYISCACEGSSLQPGHSIHWYLEQYGFAKKIAKVVS